MLKIIPRYRVWCALLVLSGMSSVTFADPPAWAGGGKDKHENKEKKEKKEKHASREGHEKDQDERRGGVSVDVHFGELHRVAVRDYYDTQIRAGHCPPGLAKKHNGCLPPGQAKKWSRGRPLPREVVYYDLPPAVVIKLGSPPSGHRYVRVASDILLIAVGTGMVVDAIEDLGRM